jgi:hypothetical protein
MPGRLNRLNLFNLPGLCQVKTCLLLQPNIRPRHACGWNDDEDELLNSRAIKELGYIILYHLPLITQSSTLHSNPAINRQTKLCIELVYPSNNKT